MTQPGGTRPAGRVQRTPQHARRQQRGSATAEFAVGVIVAVLLAAILLHLLLSAFFESLLQTLFEQILDVAVAFLATPVSWSLSELAQGAWSTVSTVVEGGAGQAWDTASDVVRSVASGVVSISRSAVSGAGSMGRTMLDTAVGALRWAGGPLMSALPW